MELIEELTEIVESAERGFMADGETDATKDSVTADLYEGET